MMNYYSKRMLNLLLQSVTFRRYYYRYSQLYSLDKRKLVSKKDKTQTVNCGGLRKPKKRSLSDYKYHTMRFYDGHYGLPSKFDLRPFLTNVKYVARNQKDRGSCTGQTTAEDQDLKEIMAGVWKGQTSADMAYYEIRKIHGWQNEDSGGNMVDEGTVLGNTGICFATTYPPDQPLNTKPSTAAYTEAKNHMHEKTQTALHVGEIKAAMVQYNSPVRFGVPIPNSFFASEFGGWVPTVYDTIVGYHSMLCVGYDDNMKNPATGTKGYFIVLNSWGPGYGDKGYVYIPYAWMNYYEPRNELDIWIQPKLKIVTPVPECVEGTIEILEWCPDGTWKTRRVCKIGKWVQESQPCGSVVTKVFVRVQSSTDEQTWKTLWSGQVA
jgi:C1A family cysteine protease